MKSFKEYLVLESKPNSSLENKMKTIQGYKEGSAAIELSVTGPGKFIFLAGGAQKLVGNAEALLTAVIDGKEIKREIKSIGTGYIANFTSIDTNNTKFNVDKHVEGICEYKKLQDFLKKNESKIEIKGRTKVFPKTILKFYKTETERAFNAFVGKMDKSFMESITPKPMIADVVFYNSSSLPSDTVKELKSAGFTITTQGVSVVEAENAHATNIDVSAIVSYSKSIQHGCITVDGTVVRSW